MVDGPDFGEKRLAEYWESGVQDGDYYCELGCCLRCSEMDKVMMEQASVPITYDTWYKGKFYHCVCLECKCTKCIYYNESGRKCDYPERQGEKVKFTTFVNLKTREVKVNE